MYEVLASYMEPKPNARDEEMTAMHTQRPLDKGSTRRRNLHFLMHSFTTLREIVSRLHKKGCKEDAFFHHETRYTVRVTQEADTDTTFNQRDRVGLRSYTVRVTQEVHVGHHL